MTFNPRWIIGRKIVEVDMHPFATGLHQPMGTTYAPVFTLDNGARIKFSVDETEVGEYGVRPVYCKRRTGKP